MDDRNSWLVIGVFAFLAGVVANICRPTRCGLIGFIASGVVSIFCGTLAALLWNYPMEQKVVMAAIVGVFADRILTAALNFTLAGRTTNINVSQWGGQSAIGDNEGSQFEAGELKEKNE